MTFPQVSPETQKNQPFQSASLFENQPFQILTSCETYHFEQKESSYQMFSSESFHLKTCAFATVTVVLIMHAFLQL